MDLTVYDKQIKNLRLTQYPQLQNTTYLDHAGTTLYARSLIDAFSVDLKQNLFGNPHSASPSSDLSTQRVEAVRVEVLRYFNADSRHFDVIFVANATAAIKLVFQAFEQAGFHYGYHRDCHTSVVGVREVALANRYFENDEAVEQWIEEGATINQTPDQLQLFAYPAQSNMTGHRPDLGWSRRIRSRNNKMHVLLDAASYLTTGRLDFSDPDSAPDFTTFSFYKIFGFPDLGALVVRKEAVHILAERKYFGGGTVDMIVNHSGDLRWHAMKTGALHEILEDGTLAFHNIIALGHAMRIHDYLFGGAEMIRQHVMHLIRWLRADLMELCYRNGRPLVKLYEDGKSEYGDPSYQGSIIAFNVLDHRGGYIGKSQIEKAAIACKIQLRTGGVCNPGGIAAMLDLQPWEMRRNFAEGMRCGDNLDVLGGKPTGIVRVSLGAMSIMEDVQRFAAMMRFWFLEMAEEDQAQEKRSMEWNMMLETVEGLPPRPVALSQRAAYDAIRGWEKDWVIVDESGRVVHGEKLDNLKAYLYPEEGNLCITAAEAGSSACKVNLWNTFYAPEPKYGFKDVHGRKADRCTDEKVNAWLSQKVGIKCALARYRSRHLYDATRERTCIKSGCHVSFNTRDQLKSHLEAHAKEFEAWLTQRPSREPETSYAQLSSTKTIDVNPREDASEYGFEQEKTTQQGRSRVFIKLLDCLSKFKPRGLRVQGTVAQEVDQ